MSTTSSALAEDWTRRSATPLGMLGRLFSPKDIECEKLLDSASGDAMDFNRRTGLRYCN